MRRSRTFIAVVGLLVVGSTALPTAGASQGMIDVVGLVVGPDPLHGAPACDAVGRCVLTVESTAEVTGGLLGSTSSAGALMFNAATNTYLTTQYTLFTGTIEGCGSGTVMMRSPEVSGSQRPFAGNIEVMLGTGTNDLRGINGGGTYRVTKDGNTYRSTWTLRLRCPRG